MGMIIVLDEDGVGFGDLCSIAVVIPGVRVPSGAACGSPTKLVVQLVVDSSLNLVVDPTMVSVVDLAVVVADASL